MNRSRVIGFVLLGVAAVAMAAQDGFKLSRAPKVGDSSKFELKASLAVQGMDVLFSATVSDKVVKVEEDGGYTIESSRSNVKIVLGGQEMPGGDQAAGTGTTKFSASGELLDLTGEGAGADGMRMAMMSNFIAPKGPVKAGDKWSHEYKATEKNGNVAGLAEFEVVGAEKIGEFDTVLVKWSYKETTGSAPATSAGKVWLSAKDADVVRLEAELKGAPLEAAGGPVDMKVTMNRVP